MFPVSEANFFCEKTGFLASSAIKQQRGSTIMVNPTMVCSYGSSCLELPVALVDCQIKGFESRLRHFCQGEYVNMHVINLDGADRKVCHNCVDKLWIVGKPNKLKKVQHRTVYRTDELEEE